MDRPPRRPAGGRGGKPAPIELTGRVHHPRKLSGGRHPMVVFEHGEWVQCADRIASRPRRQAEELLHGENPPAESARLEKVVDLADGLPSRWPCAPGNPARRSGAVPTISQSS